MTLEYSIRLAAIQHGGGTRIDVFDVSSHSQKTLLCAGSPVAIASLGPDVLMAPYDTRGNLTVWDLDNSDNPYNEKERPLLPAIGLRMPYGSIQSLEAVAEGVTTLRLINGGLVLHSPRGTKELPWVDMKGSSHIFPLGGEIVLYTTSKGATVWDLSTDKKVTTQLQIDTHVVFLPSKRLVFLSGSDLMSFEPSTGLVKPFVVGVGESSTIDSLLAMRDGRVMIITARRKVMMIVREGQKLDSEEDPPLSLCLSDSPTIFGLRDVVELDDGRLLTTDTRSVLLWPVPEKGLTRRGRACELLGSGESSGRILRLPGERLAVVIDNEIQIFDLHRLTPIARLGSSVRDIVLLEPSKREKKRVSDAVHALLDGLLVKDLIGTVVRYF